MKAGDFAGAAKAPARAPAKGGQPASKGLLPASRDCREGTDRFCWQMGADPLFAAPARG